MPRVKPKSPRWSACCSQNYWDWARPCFRSSSNKKKSLQQQGPPLNHAQQPLRYKGEVCRVYHSIFGKVTFSRPKYYSPHSGSYYGLDASLNLPRARHSYLLQSWIARAASGQAFEPSLGLLNEILGQDVKAMTAQRISQRYGAQVDAYYEAMPPAPVQGQILGLSYDGKGVRILKAEGEEAAEAAAARLMKGQKRGTKKQATVSVSFSFDRAPRRPEELAKSLHRRWSPEERVLRKEESRLRKADRETDDCPPGKALDVHRRAFLGPQKKAIHYGAQELRRRDPQGDKPIVVLIDGHRGLIKGVAEVLEEAGLASRVEATILDIVHVSEYLWKCGNALLGEAHPGREAWVYERLLKILESRLDEVIDELAAQQRPGQAIVEAVRYFSNHREMMDYRRYLAQGLPVSTGLVEGTCGHLVKDRMEGSGMRWSRSGAQHILNTRSVEKNGDWEEFSQFVKEQDQASCYRMAA